MPQYPLLLDQDRRRRPHRRRNLLQKMAHSPNLRPLDRNCPVVVGFGWCFSLLQSNHANTRRRS